MDRDDWCDAFIDELIKLRPHTAHRLDHARDTEMDRAWMGDGREATQVHLDHLAQYISEARQRIAALQAMIEERTFEDAARLAETVAILQTTVQRLEAHRIRVQERRH